MKRLIVLAGVMAGLMAGQPSFGATPQPEASNPEMKAIFDADQADRLDKSGTINGQALAKRDAERRARTRQLLAEGKLHSGADFLGAAFVFQHGSGDDYLLAHTLAVIATKKGAEGGPWIAAATLDRYLQQAGHRQIYGTQSSYSGGVWTKEPYDRDLISDALRRELGVPDVATQDARFEDKKRQGAPGELPAAKPQPATYTSVQCDTGPVTRIFARATWRITSCDNGGLLAMTDSQPPAMVVVTVLDGKVVATAMDGGDPAEVAAAVAAFSAITSDQVAGIVAETKAVKP